MTDSSYIKESLVEKGRIFERRSRIQAIVVRSALRVAASPGGESARDTTLYLRTRSTNDAKPSS